MKRAMTIAALGCLAVLLVAPSLALARADVIGAPRQETIYIPQDADVLSGQVTGPMRPVRP